MPRKTSSDTGSHQFGGDWTQRKLEVLSRYLTSYATALKNRPFKKAFIDAFAGTGYRKAGRTEQPLGDTKLLFPDLAEEAPQELLAGSARLALETNPSFDRYIFIDQSSAHCAKLEALRLEFPDLEKRVTILQGDANNEICELARKNWASHRAVLFLDPYGMQVEWNTIVAVAETRAIDLWLLFPLGIGVNRLLTRSGDIPQSWRHRLSLLLGTEDWFDEFYEVKKSPNLFGAIEETIVKAKLDTIGRYFNNRLQQVFAGVAEHPGVLYNSSNNPLYLLCFAVGNEAGKTVALRIAEHLLREMR